MKFLYPYKVDNAQAVDDLVSWPRLSDMHLILSKKADLLDAYRRYLSTRGGDVPLPALGLNADEKARMHSLYTWEGGPLSFISLVRDKMSPDICPMCGSLATPWTAEHVIEKGTHPEFSFFSANLVPACSCNVRRRACVDGVNTVRPFHPYFDKLLRRPLLRANFSGGLEEPVVSVVPVSGLGRYRGRVAAHIDGVVVPNNVRSYLRKRWDSFAVDPLRRMDLIGQIPTTVTKAQIRLRLTAMMLKAASDLGTPNNWQSVFYCGLLGGRAPAAILKLVRSGSPRGLKF